jgi:hypothetical protein
LLSLVVAGNLSPLLFLGHACIGFALTKVRTHCSQLPGGPQLLAN